MLPLCEKQSLDASEDCRWVIFSLGLTLTMSCCVAEQMSQFAQSIPFMTVPGNHERDGDSHAIFMLYTSSFHVTLAFCGSH